MAKKILVLEDEEELGRSIKKFLEQRNFKVTYINNITRIESISIESPDLIITDLLMPRFHGFDICRAVKDDPELKEIPLIVMTAVYKDAFHKLEAMRIGVEDFLEKPFKFDELLAKVERFLGSNRPDMEPVVKKEETETIKSKDKTKGAKVVGGPLAGGGPGRSGAPPLTLPEEDEIISPDIETGSSTPSLPGTAEEEKKRDDIILREFNQMQQNFGARLPEKVIELEQIWGRIQLRQGTKKQLALLRRKVHSLTGSGGTFGFEEIGEYARQIELLVDMIIVEGENTINQRSDKIDELLDNMRHHPLVSAELEFMRQMRIKT